MRKVHYFLTLILVLAFGGAQAQLYDEVDWTSGTQFTTTPNALNIQVQVTGNANINTQCATGPYQIGRTKSDLYTYTFPTPVTHVKVEFIKLHKDDTIKVYVNGYPTNPHPFSLPDLTPYAGGVCGYTSGGLTIAGTGELTTSFAGALGEGGTLVIQNSPNTMGQVTIEHIRHQDNVKASDVTYSLYVANDTCQLPFEAKVDTPLCSGRDIEFTATVMPNSQYAWTTSAPIPPNWSPSANVSNPKIINANPGQNGQYIVNAVRGNCIYSDTLLVFLSQSPSLGPIVQIGPKCPGEDDTIRLPQINLPVGGWVVAFGDFGRDTFENTGYTLPIPNIQPQHANIPYNVYAVDIQGCFSDTTVFYPKINAAVTADFSMELKYGRECADDTIVFTNLSTSDSNLTVFSYWDFDDSSTLFPNDKSLVDSVLKTITHIYRRPDTNWTDSTYTPTLFVTNGRCYDTLAKDTLLDSRIRAYYEIEDSVFEFCQGKLVEFNSDDEGFTFVKAGTTPTFVWDFKDGDSAFTLITSHVFDLAGEFYPTLYVKDELDCVDSFSVKLISDSAGFVNFNTDFEDICVGEEIVFSGEYSTSSYVTAVWDFGDGVNVFDSTVVHHSYKEPGTYDVTFDVDYRICPDAQFTGQYTVKPIPSVYIGEDTSLCMNGEQITLKDLSNVGNPQGIKYEWSTPNNEKTSEVIIRHHGRYALTADLNGCTASDTVVISKNCYIDIPNVFTPNGDGSGDYFLPRQMLSRNVAEFEMHIYNRWGKKVFETVSNNGRGWDGRLGGEDQPVGVYVYIIDVKFGNGNAERYQGNVTLLR